MSGSDRPGHDVAGEAVSEARAALGGNVLAAYALGSLAHGGFAPAVSDVDVALVLDRLEPGTGVAIDRIRDAVRGAFAESPGRALAERLSLFWSDLPTLASREEAGRFPAVDRLDLVDSGVLLFGTDLRQQVARPTASALVVDSAGFALRRFTAADYLRMLGEPETLAHQGPRAITKAVLFPIRLRYTAATGRLGRNDAAARWYLSAGHPGGTLVAAAMQWRDGEPVDPGHAAALLHSALVALYADFAEDLSAHLSDLGRPDMAHRLRTFRAALPAM